MMIGKLVALIEDHADELTARMVRLVRENPMTEGYNRFDDEELGGRARWCTPTWADRAVDSESHVEEEYYRIGRLRHRKRASPSLHVVMALLLTRRNLWRFVESRLGTIFDLRQQLDLELLVVRFFDERSTTSFPWVRSGR